MQYGSNFGSWTVIDENIVEGKIQCKCICGTVRYCSVKNLKRGRSKSCGCIGKEKLIKRNTVHADANTTLYSRWTGILRRCCYAENTYYKERGITVCVEWRESFEAFKQWAVANGYEPNLEIDRIDNNGNYEPSNCRWVSRKVNARNKRSNKIIEIDGISKSATEWAEQYAIPYKTFMSRFNRGWRGKDLLQPVETKFSKRKDFL